jgi:alpha-tubulin suppressor-like RCC1 family protein
MLLTQFLTPSANVVNSSANTTLSVWGLNSSGQLGNGTTINKSLPTVVSNFLNGRSFTQIVNGANHNLLIDTTGGLWTWGNNAYGQLGDGTTVNKNSAVSIPPNPVSWKSISTGGYHSAAIRSDDSSLWMWGNNPQGQLGDGTTISKSSPVQIGTNSWYMVSVGSNAINTGNSLAIDSTGALYAWGHNPFGQLGDGTTVSKSSPVKIGSSSWIAVFAGKGGHAAGITIGGSLYTWGNNANGRLGDGTIVDKSSPVKIGSSSWTITSIGADYTAAIDINGGLYTWGNNANGRLGDGTIVDKSSPVKIGSSSWNVVSAAANHVAGITIDGSLYTWGNGSLGNLGNGTTVDKSSPVKIGSSSWTIASASNGGSSSAGITIDGSLYTWGLNTNGQLGDGTTVDKSSPVKIGSSSWTSVYAGSTTIMATNLSLNLYTWGRNQFGQLGDGTIVDKSSPVLVSGAFSTNIGYVSWISIGTANNSSFATDSKNRLYAWGDNSQYQVGDGTTINRSTPTQIYGYYYPNDPAYQSWKSIKSGGGSNIFAIRQSDSTLWGWGFFGTSNSATFSCLGNNTTDNFFSNPVQLGTSSWISISSNGYNTAGITSTGALYTWGYNGQGGLGDGTTINKIIPIQIGTSSWSIVSVGDFHVAAITTAGSLYSWGYNGYGQLGDGTSSPKSSPVQIGTSSWSTVSAGASSTAGITTTGALYTWGSSTFGQLGDGTTVTKLSPVQIGTSSWSFIAANPNTAGITSTGALYAWGYNGQGQLGDGTTINKSSPVQIGTSSWSFISLGLNTAGITSTGALYTWGYNGQGGLGDGTTITKSSPVKIGSSSWISVNSQTGYVFGLTSSKTLYNWGSGFSSTTTSVVYSSPVQVASIGSSLPSISESSFKSIISSGYGNFAYAISANSSANIYSWGVNSGNVTINPAYPLVTSFNNNATFTNSTDKSWKIVSSNLNSTYAIRNSDKKLFAWGYNLLLDSINVNYNNKLYPALNQNLSSLSYNTVSVGDSHVAAITTAGSLYTWGNNPNGQLGYGTGGFGSPTLVPGQVGTSSWTAVSCGLSYTLGLTTAGALYAWGLNNAGQLGDGTTIDKVSPVQVPLTATYTYDSWKIISYSFGNAFGIKSLDGSLWGWGDNFYGQLGDNTVTPKSSPVKIGSSSWTTLSTGDNIVLAITTTGALFAWGYNVLGELGDGTTINKSSPVQIGTSSWTSVSSTFSHSTAIDINGALYTWGYNANGQLGDGTTINKSSPVVVQVVTSTLPSSWKAVAAGGNHKLAIRNSDSSLWAWGENSFGQLGDGTTVAKSTPVKIGSSSWSKIAAGDSHSVAIDINGGLYTWGRNTYTNNTTPGGQLGDGTTLNKSSPVKIGSSSWTAITAGQVHTQAIDIVGRLFGWGYQASAFATFGDNTIVAKSSPVQIGTSSWTKISAGDRYTHGTTTTGALYGWGYNTSGRLGDGTTIDKSSPVLIASGTSFVFVGNGSAGGATSAAISNLGALYTWGYNGNGGLGNNSTLPRSTPAIIASGTSFTVVSMNNNSVGGIGAAITTTGALYTWGYNQTGTLGDGTTIDKSSPVKIGSSSWTAVAIGGGGAMGIDSVGRLFTWGNGSSGQLGDNTVVTGRSSPVLIFSVNDNVYVSWKLVSAGTNSTHAIDNTSALYAWGVNNFGQLGDGTTIAKSSPVKIGTSSWSVVSAGRDSNGTGYTAGITITGALFTWGANATYGNLGDGTTINKSSPVQIGTSSWSKVSAGGSHTVAIDITGALYAWGYNNYGQLGDNTVTPKSSPVKIGTSSWSIVSASSLDTGAISATNGSLFVWGGSTTAGQLGDGTTISKSSPVQLPFIASTSYTYSSWSFIGAGNGGISVGITTAGALYTWGNNAFYGALGDGTTVNKSFPVQIGTSSWAAVSAGLSHVLGITTTGALFTWGYNGLGQLGSTSVTNRSSPVQVGSSSWTFISAGLGSSAGITITGALYTWGGGGGGVLGDGFIGQRSSPVQIGTSNSWTAINLGYSHTQAISSTGDLYTWGINQNGQLGIGDTLTRSLPVIVLPRTTGGASIRKITTTNSGTSLFLDLGKTVTSLGSNLNGELGNFININNNFFPVPYGVINNVSDISSGNSHNISISNNQLYLWGDNTKKQINNSNLNINYPTTISNFVSYDSWKVLSAGSNSMAGIKSADGSLWTWGLNAQGQLGDGTTLNKSLPIQIGTSSWTTVSTGYSFVLAVTSAGALYAWGLNSAYQLGDGTTVNKSSPTQVATGLSYTLDTSSWKIIAVGGSHTVAIKNDGSLWAWGLNSSGQLGDGTLTNKNIIQVGTSSWTTVSAGANYTIGITTDGTLWAWGGNGNGQLGNGSLTNTTSPTQVVTATSYVYDTSSWKIISNSNGFSLGIKQNGSLWAWGINNTGQLGDGTTILKNIPVQIGTSSWTTVSASVSYTAGITTTGALFTWGNNLQGQLGDGTTIAKSSPVQIGTSSWTTVSTSSGFTAGITTTGALYTWGISSFGQLGDGTVVAKSSPVKIGTSSWSIVSLGNAHTAAIDITGSLFTWGQGTTYQLGNGTATNRSSPGQIGTGTSFTVVSAGYAHTLAISNTGNLYGVGGNTSGQLGINTINNLINFLPINIDKSWTTVSAGFNHSVGITTDGTLWAWGLNSSGNLGDGTIVAKSSPVQIGTSSWNTISTTSGGISTTVNSAGIDSTGALYIWGSNASLALADGTTDNKSSPVHVLSTINTSFSSFSIVSAGFNWSTAIDINGQLYTWGGNSSGQLGDGTVTGKYYAGIIRSSSWSIVSGGSSHTAGITTTGALYTWGYNGYGQLGDGTTLNKSSPVQIGTSSWAIVASGASSTAAIDITGALFTWGVNTVGQLGDGTTISKSSPVQIGTSSWTLVSAISGTLFAINIFKNLYSWGGGGSGGLGDGTTINKSSPVQIGTSSWNMVATGSTAAHGAGITLSGSVFAWGYNANGQLGNFQTTARTSPVPLVNNSTLSYTSSFSIVSAGFNWSTAIDITGALYTWGNNTFGQLGITPSINIPTQVGTSSWTTVSAGGSHTVGITTDGTLYAWGNNTYGQLGDSGNINRSSPVLIPAIGTVTSDTSSWKIIAVGGSHTVGIKASDGSLWTWGYNNNTQLGDGTAFTRIQPIQIGTSSWTTVSAGGNHTVGITTDGTLWAWGLNSSGQLGDGTATNRASPIQIGLNLWSAVTCGNLHTAAIDITGALFTWGSNSAFGQLGDSTTVTKSSPVQIGTSSWSTVSAGASSTAGITTTGALYTWGANGAGQLGDGTTITKSSPVKIGTSSWSKVSAGSSSIAAITNLGSLYIWGFNNPGIIGDGTTISKSSPVQLGTSSWTSVSVSVSNIAAVTTAGSLYTWGVNFNGVLGNNTNQGVIISSPVQIGTSSWTAVFTFGTASHVAAISSTGSLYTWGSNSFGQLGNNPRFSTINSSPTIIGLGTVTPVTNSSFSIVSAGNTHTVAIDISGQLWSWGSNVIGQLGDGTTIGTFAPETIGTSSWTTVSAGSSHTAGITTAGTLYTWGGNVAGSLGDNTPLNKSSPVQIGTAGSWTLLSTGASNTVAIGIKPFNLLFTWGYNGTGALGDGTIVNKSSPVIISALTTNNTINNVTAIATGLNHTTFANLNTNNSYDVYGIGDNTYGQLGYSTTTNGYLTRNYQYLNGVFAGGNHTFKK